jgi:carbon monoxide dehydrogenase subunit G
VTVLSVTASVVVTAPPERAWELLSDSSRYAEWVEGTEAVLRADGIVQEGSTYEERNPIVGPWKARTSWTVVEFQPLRRQVHRSADVPLSSRFDVIMELQPEGEATRVTLTLEGAPSLGPLGRVFDKLMHGMVERDNRKTVANFAALIASSPDPGA